MTPTIANPFAHPLRPMVSVVVAPDDGDDETKTKPKRPRVRADWRELDAVVAPWAAMPRVYC